MPAYMSVSGLLTEIL